jgi:hypothetical protein
MSAQRTAHPTLGLATNVIPATVKSFTAPWFEVLIVEKPCGAPSCMTVSDEEIGCEACEAATAYKLLPQALHFDFLRADC